MADGRRDEGGIAEADGAERVTPLRRDELIAIWDVAIAAGEKPLDLWLSAMGKYDWAKKETIEKRVKLRRLKAQFADDLEALINERRK
jgi:hypothetical protein